MEKVKEIQEPPKMLQVAHGKVIPQYVSAYSLRCHSLLKTGNKTLISFAGAIFKDEKAGYSEQYRSLLVTGISLIMRNRTLEIYISRGRFIRKKYLRRLRELAKESDIIIFEGPWQYSLISDIIENKFLVYDAHNVEYSLREGNKFREECRAIEEKILDKANIILSVTNRDMKIFKDTYHVNESKLYFCPHIGAVSGIRWNGLQSNHVVFIGSIYAANNSALLQIYKLARDFSDCIFDVIGSVKGSRKPKLKNLVMHGTVDDNTKDEIMSNSFIALNPVTEGSGRNVKMVDYFAHGLPVISTQIGARGFEDFDLTKAAIVCEPDQFGTYLNELKQNQDKLRSMSEESHRLYEKILNAEKRIDPEEIILNAYNKQKREKV